jgi:predicted nucleic acid-binding protein
MTNSPVIADTGFWVALTNRADSHHWRATRVLAGLDRRLIATWPILTETCHILLCRAGQTVQLRFVERWVRRSFEVYELNLSHAPRIEALMRQYADLPMDLADASLVVLAEALGHGDILSTDQRVFRCYRWKQRKAFTNLLLAGE